MASPQILNALMQGGIDPVARPNWDQKRLAGQQINESQQQMGQRNMLFQQQQEDRQRGIQAEEQQRINSEILNAAAPMLMPGVTEEQAAALYQQTAPAIKQKYPHLQVPDQYPGRQALVGMLPLPQQLRDKLFEAALAPPKPTGNLPIEEVGVGNGMFQKAQVGPDGRLTPIGQPYRKAADASVDLRRDLADQKTEAAQAKAEASRQKAADTYDYTLNLIDGLRNHPGLETAVGAKGVTGGLMFGQVVPGTDAADFVARLDQLGGRQFLQAFESLKGGGQITQIEGEKATNAIARLQRSQSEKEFRAALDEFYGVLDLGLKRLRGEAPMPGEPQGAQTAGPTSGRFRVVRRK